MSEPVFPVPFNFLGRQEDRDFIMRLRGLGCSRDYARVALLLLWQDFARNGTKERLVPIAREQWSSTIAVRVIEEICEWEGEGREPGAFVAAAVDSGFLRVREVEDLNGALSLAGFAAAMQSGGSTAPGSMQRNGSAKSARIRTQQTGERDAGDLFDVLHDTQGELVEKLGRDRYKAALALLCQICRIMGWKQPEVSAWTRELVEQAAGILARHNRPVIDRRLEWICATKSTDLDAIPGRIDLLINRWDSLPAIAS